MTSAVNHGCKAKNPTVANKPNFEIVIFLKSSQHPVLLQGETSVGKTSLITWLAKSSGNVCVRVNNHEHTDLQEYVGCYAADENGKLAFREGKKVLNGRTYK